MTAHHRRPLGRWLLGALVLLGTGVTLSAQAPGAAAVTAASIVSDLAAGTEYRAVKASYLLTFSSQVDDPLYVDSALLAVELMTGKWHLVHAFRHPRASLRRNRAWDLAVIADARDYSHFREFDGRPTESDVEQFLRDTRWKWGPFDSRYTLLRGTVYSDTWRKVFGYEPKHQYSKTP